MLGNDVELVGQVDLLEHEPVIQGNQPLGLFGRQLMLDGSINILGCKREAFMPRMALLSADLAFASS